MHLVYDDEAELDAKRIDLTAFKALLGSVQGYTHLQPVASDTWVVEHNLGRIPTVVITDEENGGTVLEADILHDDGNTLQIFFKNPETGAAYIN